MEVQVFDPAMCCSTGVCGPKVDPALARFASDLAWLGEQGATVSRFNLGQEPGAFVASPAIRELLQLSGEAALPVVMVDGEVKSSGRYPSRSDLAAWANVPEPAGTGRTGPEPRVPVALSSAPLQPRPGAGATSRSGCY